MTRTKLACKKCKITNNTIDTPLGEWNRKYIHKLRKIYIREYIPENPNSGWRERKGKFKTNWIPIGLFCPKCGNIIIDKSKISEDMGIKPIEDGDIEKITFI